MLSLPSAAKPIFMSLSVAFSDSVFRHVVVLMIGAIVARGPHRVTTILRTVRLLATAHFSTYHRVLSRAAWAPRVLQQALACLVLERIPANQVVEVVCDETVAEHRGPKVYGKGCYRDAVRSSRKHTSFRWGHQWVTLAILVRFPFARRPWALPILTALFLPKKLCQAQKRRYKTAPELARQMLAVLIRAFPQRKFTLIGDGAYATVELAAFCCRHGHSLVSRLRPDAALYAEPKCSKNKRQLLVGRRLDSPREAAQRKNAPWRKTRVSWYGGQKRKVRWLTGLAIWYRRGRTPIRLRWVYVVDREGNQEDRCLFSTDLSLTPAEIIERYIHRWSIEVTFEEVRAHLGFETTRQWSRRAVLRAAPGLLGMFTIVTLIFATHTRHHQARPASTAWYSKKSITFSDAIATVRRLFWSHTLLAHCTKNHQCARIPEPLRKLILDDLSMAA